MNTSQKDLNKPVMDEVDDLTRFLDEDFATDEVDLFEFTSGEEDSPLTQLKTIILGLDWEITDEALQDLADEIDQLRNLEQFQHDKVSQVYLQALDKIGNYVLTEGAHAHHNAIKLLMTLFYDFEKITSSEHITGAEITALLKADVRKFKILQYQIAQKHGTAIPAATAAAADLPITEHKTLLGIHAAILEIDWEVTDETLSHLTEQLTTLKEEFTDSRYIQIVIRGLSTLNSYIDEERARTHPEAFSLLHIFFETLETLVDDKELDEENSQKLLINCVNRLNNLKSLIIQTPQELDDEAITPISEGVEEKVVPEEELTTEEPVAETAPEIAEVEPADEAPAGPQGVAGKAEEEDVLDVELPVDEGGEVAPALFESEEESSFVATDEGDEEPSEELEEKLQFFFGEDEDVPEPPPEEEFVEEPVEKAATEEAVAVASPEVEEEAPVAEAAPAEVADEPAAEAPAAPPGAAGEAEEEDVLDVVLPVDETGEVAPALFDSEEEGGFGITEEEAETPSEELEGNLQSFFGEDEETFEPEAVEEAVAQKKVEEDELAAAALKEKEEEEEELSIAPALAGEPEESGFAAEADDLDAPPDGLEEKLEFFFGEDEAPKEETAAKEEHVVEADIGEAPEALFEDEEDEEEVLLTPALAAEDQEEEIVESPLVETIATVSTSDDYNAAIEKMRVEFQEREQSLMDEIATLKQEVESLRSQ
jgi:pilus assembly protein FimV